MFIVEYVRVTCVHACTYVHDLSLSLSLSHTHTHTHTHTHKMCVYTNSKLERSILFQLKENNPCILSSLCAGILAGTLLLPLFFYGYTYLLGKDMLFLDLTDFALSVILAFFLVYKFTLSCRLQNYTASLCLAVCILFLCFVLFTSYPPDLPIFHETG